MAHQRKLQGTICANLKAIQTLILRPSTSDNPETLKCESATFIRNNDEGRKKRSFLAIFTFPQLHQRTVKASVVLGHKTEKITDRKYTAYKYITQVRKLCRKYQYPYFPLAYSPRTAFAFARDYRCMVNYPTPMHWHLFRVIQVHSTSSIPRAPGPVPFSFSIIKQAITNVYNAF